jgi:hypothetical protein
VFVDKGGYVDLSQFYRTNWNAKGIRMSRSKFHRTYRPDCKMVKAVLLMGLPIK